MQTKAGWHGLLLTLAGTMALVLAPFDSAFAQEERLRLVTVGVPPSQLIDHILKVGESELYFPPRPSSLRDALKARCGYVTATLLGAAAALNQIHQDDADGMFRRKDKDSYQIPPCIKALLQTDYWLQRNDTNFGSYAEPKMGLVGPYDANKLALVGTFCELNPKLLSQSSDAAELTRALQKCKRGPILGGMELPGAHPKLKIVLPAEKITSLIRLQAGHSSKDAEAEIADIIKRTSPKAERELARNVRTTIPATWQSTFPDEVKRFDISNGFLLLTGSVAPAAILHTPVNCTSAHAQIFQLNSKELLSIWHAGRDYLGDSASGKIVVTLIDNGLLPSSSLFNWIHSIDYNKTEDGGSADDEPTIAMPPLQVLQSGQQPFYDHGTHVAGLAMGGPALLNNVGVDQWPFRIRFFRSLQQDAENGEYRLRFEGFQKAFKQFLPKLVRTNDLVIANVSMEATSKSYADADFIKENNQLLLVVAAGNNSNGAPEDLDSNIVSKYPAQDGGVDSPTVITVGASNSTNRAAAPFSHFGENRVDLFAPGECIESFSENENREEIIKPYSGTSQAAPLVTFTAALLSSLGIKNPEEIKNRIISTVDDAPSLDGKTYSRGTLNITDAIDIYVDRLSIKSKDSRGLPSVEFLRGALTPSSNNELICQEGVRKVNLGDVMRLQFIRSELRGGVQELFFNYLRKGERLSRLCARRADGTHQITLLTKEGQRSIYVSEIISLKRRLREPANNEALYRFLKAGLE